MKTPDPHRSLQYDQPSHFAEDSAQETSEGLTPLDTLLAESGEPELDDERLYTDEFIRANENASRSLFLGFLGIAFLVTSLFAWFILGQPQQESDDDAPDLSEPVTIPSPPPSNSPNLPLDVEPVLPPAQPNSNEGEGSSVEPQQPSLVFPANPTTPDNATPSQSPPLTPNPLPESTDPDNQGISPVPEESVPPPPPVQQGDS